MSAVNTIDIRGDQELLNLLQRTLPEELGLLVDYLTDNGRGRMALSGEVCASLVKAKQQRHYPEHTLRMMIRELQCFGGNSIVNLFRSSGVDYSEIVIDVLEHLKGTREEGESLADIEAKILKKLWGLTLDGVSQEQRAELVRKFEAEKLSGHVAEVPLSIAQLLTHALAASSFGVVGGMTGSAVAGTGLVASRAAAVALGPVGLALSGIWGASSLASPAYRVTVPCVVLIAYLRMKRDA